MESSTGTRRVRMSTLMDFSQLTVETKNHLRNVYVCLTLCMISASVGAFLYVVTEAQKGYLANLVSIGLMLWLGCITHTKENQVKRLCILSAFGAFCGYGLGPSLRLAIAVDPQIIVTAFVMTTVIFMSFSLSALYAQQRTYLYLGGILFSGLVIVLITSFLSVYFHSFVLFRTTLYVGTAIACAYILYDTQLIVEEYTNGDNDYIWHSVKLFIDFLDLFHYLLMLLSSDEKED